MALTSEQLRKLKALKAQQPNAGDALRAAGAAARAVAFAPAGTGPARPASAEQIAFAQKMAPKIAIFIKVHGLTPDQALLQVGADEGMLEVRKGASRGNKAAQIIVVAVDAALAARTAAANVGPANVGPAFAPVGGDNKLLFVGGAAVVGLIGLVLWKSRK